MSTCSESMHDAGQNIDHTEPNPNNLVSQRNANQGKPKRAKRMRPGSRSRN